MARRVLVVDDDPLTLEILGTILDLEEFEVDSASRGDDALRMIRENDYDVVVSDVMMPGMTGCELVAQLRREARSAELPVILLTARSSADDRAEGAATGATAYLTKPFSPLGLIDTIRELVGG